MAFSLYEINSQIEQALNDAFDRETGEIINEDAVSAWNHLEMQKDEKIEQLALLYKNLVAEAAALRAEKAVFAARQSTAEKKAESVKQYLARMCAGEKRSSDKYKISWRKSESVKIANGAFLPDEYLTYSEPSPNAAEIKKALKAGKKIDGATLVTANNIQIK